MSFYFFVLFLFTKMKNTKKNVLPSFNVVKLATNNNLTPSLTPPRTSSVYE